MVELVEKRVLGALRFRDRATGRVLTRPMILSAAGATFVQNRSHYYVITGAPGLAAHTEAFDSAPTAPPLGDVRVTVEVHDPLHRYLPRLAAVQLPRDPDPAHAGAADSLFRPADVDLYVASTAPVLANWSTIRASVSRNDSTAGFIPVRGCLLRVVRASDDEILASGISDERGEALVIVPGVPITQFADDDGGTDTDDGPVIVSELPVRLEASFDPSVEWPVNPDVLETSHSAAIRATEDLTLKTGRMERVSIALTL